MTDACRSSKHPPKPFGAEAPRDAPTLGDHRRDRHGQRAASGTIAAALPGSAQGAVHGTASPGDGIVGGIRGVRDADLGLRESWRKLGRLRSGIGLARIFFFGRRPRHLGGIMMRQAQRPGGAA